MKNRGETRIAFGPLSGVTQEMNPARTVIVTDAAIRALHGASFPSCPVIEVEAGEAAKSLSGLEGLYGKFLELGVDRESTVLSVGGGSVSDLAGFAASTWMRGIDFGFAPSTLLAMTDASVGGKNGIDYRGYKNLVGTIEKPRFVRFDTSLLATLGEADFASGMAEAIKHAVLEGEGHFGFLESRCASFASLAEPDLEELVRRSVAFKTAVTDRDEKEDGERRKLNLGHTIGHALEATTGVRHGEAVAAGLAAAFELSVSRYGGDAKARDRTLALLSSWRLPVTVSGCAAGGPRGEGQPDGGSLRERVSAALFADKKRFGKELLFALPLGIGDVRICPISISTLCDFIKDLP